MARKYLFLFLLVMFFIGCETKVKENANLDDIIFDEAHIIHFDHKSLKMYRDFNEQLLKDFDIDFRVMTTVSDENIDSFANKKFNELLKNSRSKSANALLLVINSRQNMARLEVPLGLEHIFTDAYVSYIEREGMVPYFQDSKIADGVYMFAELTRDRAYEQSKELVKKDEALSVGAGAKVAANIGKKEEQVYQDEDVKSGAKDTPKTVLKKYLSALKENNNNPNLSIYTTETKEFFKKHTTTTINQDNEVKFLTPCLKTQKTLFSYNQNYAVVANDFTKQRTCSPYFFKKEDGKWKLDIATMAQVLRFNVNMQWHFDMETRLKNEAMNYAFAFDGYGFDKSGFPFVSTWVKPDGIRWGYVCGQWYKPEDKDVVRKEPEKYIKCYIQQIWYGTPAMVRLGLEGSDSIYAIGEGKNKKVDVSFIDFMKYMKNVPKGSKVTIEVIPKNSQNVVVKQGIAP